MIKIFFLIIIFLFNSLGISEDKAYLGVEVSQNDFGTNITALSGTTLDTEDTGFAIIAGFKAHKNFDIEASYEDFGKATLSGDSGDTFKIDSTSYEFATSASIDYEVTTLALGVKPHFNIGEKFQAFIRGGFHMYDEVYTVNVGTASAGVEEEDTGFYYGVGISTNFYNFIAEASYSQYTLDEEDITSLSVMLGYRLNF